MLDSADMPAPEQLERWKAERDVELRARELDLRTAELRLKRQDAKSAKWSSPLFLAVLGLAATLLINAMKSSSDAAAAREQEGRQSAANRDLERQRFESMLIQKAVETPEADEAAKRLKFLVDLGFVRDEQKKIAAYVSKPESIPLQPPDSDRLLATDRASARVSVGALPVQEFADFTALRKSLPREPDEPGVQRLGDAPRNAPRSAEEQRNVAAPVYVYAAKLEAGHDIHLIIGPAPDLPDKTFMTAVVSGLPADVGHPSYRALTTVREAFKEQFPEIQTTGSGNPGGYRRFDPPRLVRIQGSLYFNSLHPPGTMGPTSMRPDTRWEIRPITALATQVRSK